MLATQVLRTNSLAVYGFFWSIAKSFLLGFSGSQLVLYAMD